MYTMIPLKWLLTLRLLPFSGRHLGFPVDSILAAFRSRSIFRKSHKDTLLHLSRFQDMQKKVDWGVILPPPVGHRRVNLQIFTESRDHDHAPFYPLLALSGWRPQKDVV